MLRSLFKTSLVLGFVELIIRAKTFIVLPLMTFYLGPSLFGIWSQIIALSAFFVPFVMLGTDASVMRYIPGVSRKKQTEYFFSWLVFLVTSCSVIFIFIVLFSDRLSVHLLGSKAYVDYILLASLTLLSNILFNSIKIWYRALENLQNYSYFLVIQAIISLLATFLLVYIRFPLNKIILILALTDLHICLAVLLIVLMKEKKNITLNLDFLHRATRYGAPLFFSGLSMWGLNYADRFILPGFVSTAEVGIYVLVYQIGAIIMQILTTPIWTQFQGKISSMFNRGELKKYQEFFDATTLVIFGLSFPVVVGLTFMSKDILLIVAPKSFSEGACLMPLIAMGYVFHMLASCHEVVIGLHNKQKIITITSLLVLLINVGSNLVLLPLYGIKGAALSTLICFFFQYIFAVILTNRFSMVEIKYYQFIKISISATTMGILMYVLEQIIFISIFVRVIEAIIGTLFYFSLICYLKVIPMEYLHDLKIRIWSK